MCKLNEKIRRFYNRINTWPYMGLNNDFICTSNLMGVDALDTFIPKELKVTKPENKPQTIEEILKAYYENEGK